MFFDVYVKNTSIENPSVVEIGSMDNHSSIYKHIPEYIKNYTGVDYQEGPNVDIVLKDPYKFPIEDNSVDIIVCSSVFEHVEFFWLSILEMYRVVKSTGLIYINAPSNGSYHRHPVDCWRFYPDAGDSFVNWGKRNQYNPLLLESFVNQQHDFPMSIWNDYVCIILKEASYADLYPNQILDSYKDVWFGKSLKIPMFNKCTYVEDQMRLFNLMNIYHASAMNEEDSQFIRGLKWYGK